MLCEKIVPELATGPAAFAAGRLFRAYEQHCQASGPDTLFQILTAMHSLSDRLKKEVGRDFHEIVEFVALKSLRNLAHHEEELRTNVSFIPAPAISDLAVMCIVRRDQVERAIENVDKRWREGTRAACETRFHWYGPAVNINPCLFNFMVKAYEMLVEVGVRPAENASASFEESYRFEEEQGFPHSIDGRLTTNLGEVSAVLARVVETLPSP